MKYQVRASTLSGKMRIPSSKSHTLRAILFASLAQGESRIHQYLHSPDTLAMIKACRLLGASIVATDETLAIVGVNGQPQTPADVIDAGNSGQVLRFIAAICALTEGYTVLTGDHSILYQRPVKPLLDGLQGLNVFAVSTQDNARPPIIIKGPLMGGETSLEGQDSQPISALLMACAFAPKPSIIQVTSPGETPWIDLTLDWFKRLGIPYTCEDHRYYTVQGSARYPGFEYTVPGDFSSAAFPLIGALITGSELVLDNITMSDSQGDKALIPLLQGLGAVLNIKDKSIHISPSPKLQINTVQVNDYIDALPILAVLACFAKNETQITGASIARHKESDRLKTITQELRKMGANIHEKSDGLVISPSALQGAVVDSHHDHRIAMAVTIAGLAATGTTVVQDIECIDKSFPGFAASFQAAGADLEVTA